MADIEKKLYECELSATVYVLATSKQEAERIALDDATSKIDEWDVGSFEIKDPAKFTDTTEEPYGSEDGLTIQEWLDAKEEHHRNQPPTRAELEECGQLALLQA